ncbi:MAG: DUF354 domain-containing protein [Thermoprotei archaeon]
MRIWIDILTPKYVLFFKPLIWRLKKNGHDVLITSREYRETVELLRIKGVDALIIGKYGGETLKGKLIASIERMQKMINIAEEFKPDLTLSSCSPDLTRVAFGLNIPHVSVSESVNSKYVMRLTLPLSRLLLAPAYIPIEEWLVYGISRDRIITYKGLDALAWLSDFTPDNKILDALNIKRDKKKLVLIRPEERFASYLSGKTNIMKRETAQMLLDLVKKRDDVLFVFLPRYQEDIPILKDLYGDFSIILDRVVDGASLLNASDIFVGGGGTMSQEAVLLGIPTISVYPERYPIGEYLISRGVLTRVDISKLPSILNEYLDNLNEVKINIKRKVEMLKREMENPIDVIINAIESKVWIKEF